MKKLFITLLLFSVTYLLYGVQEGRFFKNIEKQNVLVENIHSQFNKWFNLPPNTTFQQYEDRVDDLGIRHLAFYQFVDGVQVSNAMVLVHAKDGKVTVINGDILESSVTPAKVQNKISTLKAVQKVNKKATEKDATLKIVRVNINGKTQYRYAFEVLKADRTAKQYVDAETGEIIKNVPLVYNADVQGTATTMYNGTQAITCWQENGLYYLEDKGRNIRTLDANNNPYKIDYDGIQAGRKTAEQEILNYINACICPSNTSIRWQSSWSIELSEVTITKTTIPNFYFVVQDKSDKELFTSVTQNNPTLPITIQIAPAVTLEFSNAPYYISVFNATNKSLLTKFPVGYYRDMFGRRIEGLIKGENTKYEDKWKSGQDSIIIMYNTQSKGIQPLFDAHWGMEKTIDFYKETFNRNSYDNKGSIIYNVVNPHSDEEFFSVLPSNAFANTEAPVFMAYGMGEIFPNMVSFNPLVSIDIMAHEFTHLVTDRNGHGSLEYKNESGALNESFSDIMGIAVKKYATGKNDWLIGSGMMVNAPHLRSMKKPNDGPNPQPDTYKGEYWVDYTDPVVMYEDSDNGGVHTNSGVQNFWFYLLSQGGKGTNDKGDNYEVANIGIDKATRIAYRNLTNYLTPEARYFDARHGSIQAAIDLYGGDSKEHQSVANAWHAVGVGSKYGDEDNSMEGRHYIILAQRDETSNWFYMTCKKDNTWTSKGLFDAVDANTNVLTEVQYKGLDANYRWQVINNNVLKTDLTTSIYSDLYVNWKGDNSVCLDGKNGAEGTLLSLGDAKYTFSIGSDEDMRYLSLHNQENNFAFYPNTTQCYQLTFIDVSTGVATDEGEATGEGESSEEGESTTDLGNVSNESVSNKARKVIEEGNIYIVLPDGTKYNSLGVKVK